MNRLKTLALATLLFTGAAHADLVEGDWKADGDGLAVYDTDTGLTWLDLRASHGKSILDVNAELDTTYSGFGLASPEQVATLFNNALPDTYSGSEQFEAGNHLRIEDLDRDYVRNLSELFTAQSFHSPTGLGIAPDGDGSVTAKTTHFGADFISHENPSTRTIDFSYSRIGVWLVDDGGVKLEKNEHGEIIGFSPLNVTSDVSAPLIGSAGLLLGLAGLRRRRK